MAKTKTKKEAAVEVVEVVEAVEVAEVVKTQESPWYVFCSTGCGFCKKAEPVIEELNKEGHDILVLDLVEPDNQKLNKELQAEYKVQCGTPWFINAETGKSVCGFREKSVLEKWLAGEDIPEPPRPKGMPPRPPFEGASKKEVSDWKQQYNKWVEDNEHLPAERRKPAEEILKMPRPKSEPPRPPMGQNVTDESIDEWGEEYKKWAKENSHLPNVQNADQLVQNFKNRQRQMANAPQNQQMGAPQRPLPGPPQNPSQAIENNKAVKDLGSKVELLESKFNDVNYKLDKLVRHFEL